MNDDRLFGPKVDHHNDNEFGSGVSGRSGAPLASLLSMRNSVHPWATGHSAMGTIKEASEEQGEPKRLSVELPHELQGVPRPRKRSSWFSEMCLGKEAKLNDMELSSQHHTPSSSSISGGASRGGVGSRLRASIFSVLGKLGR